MKNPERWFELTCKITVIDVILLFFVGIGIIISYFDSSWMSMFVLSGWFCATVWGIKNGRIHMISKANISERNLYQITDNENNNTHILASSSDEAELLVEHEKISGIPSYIGKVKYFE